MAAKTPDSVKQITYLAGALKAPRITAAWFAVQIDMGEDWVRRNVKRLPHHKVGRLTKFDEHCVDLFRERTAVRPHDPMVRTPGSRARKR